MDIKKLPLSKRIERLRTGHPAHEEYYASVICSIALTPICAYMDSFDVGWDRLRERLSLEVDQPDELTYMQVASHVAAWYKSDQARPDAIEAMRLLAVPLLEAQELFKQKKEEEQANR